MPHGGRRKTPADQVPVLMRQAKQTRRMRKAGKAVRRTAKAIGRVTRTGQGIGKRISRARRRK